jgi:hypothetical protein
VQDAVAKRDNVAFRHAAVSLILTPGGDVSLSVASPGWHGLRYYSCSSRPLDGSFPMLRTHLLASGLRGFASSSLRVRLVETLRDGSVAVVTADLLDAGTPLVLSPSQVEEVRD